MADPRETSSVADILKRYEDRRKYRILNESAVQLPSSPFIKVYPVEFQFREEEWYYGGGGWSLTSPALSRLCAAVGISVTASMRTDNGENPNLAVHAIQGVLRAPDGTCNAMMESKSFDVNAFLDDTYRSKRADQKNAQRTDEQIRAEVEALRPPLQRFRAERAATGALERLVRKMVSIPTSVKKDDKVLTYVYIVSAPNMDVLMMDPAIRQMAAAQALQSVGAVFGGGARMLGAGNGNYATEAPALPPPAETESNGGFVNAEVVEESPVDLNARMNALLRERDHGLTDSQLDKLKDVTDERKKKWIAFLESKPKKQTNGSSWKPSEKQIARLFGKAKTAGIDSDALHALIARWYNGISSVNDLTREQYDELCGDDEKGVAGKLETYASECAQDGLPF